MDGFEIRLQLVTIIRKLSSSQNSIQTTVRFMLKHQKRYGEDLWDCLVEECEKASLNSRINILYLIDSLLITSSSNPTTTNSIKNSKTMKEEGKIIYGELIRRDIKRLIESIVPINFKKKGLLNLMSTQQVLKNWKNQLGLIDRFINLECIDDLDRILNERKSILASAEVDLEGIDNDFLDFSKREILDRIDDDRERHKRLRERIWILPIPPLSSYQSKPNLSNNSSITNNSYSLNRSATLLYKSIIRSSTNLSTSNSSNEPNLKKSTLHQPQPKHSSSSMISSNPKHLIKLSNSDFDSTISLECDQLINSFLEENSKSSLERSERNKRKKKKRKIDEVNQNDEDGRVNSSVEKVEEEQEQDDEDEDEEKK